MLLNGGIPYKPKLFLPVLSAKPIAHMTNQHKIKHLFWRAGFGLSAKEFENHKNANIYETVNFLINHAQKYQTLEAETTISNLSMAEIEAVKKDKAKLRELKKKSKRLVRKLNTDWVMRMAAPDKSALLERMSLFWHGHFACDTKISHLAINQLNTIRQHCLGNFRSFVKAIARDPSMIRYLNNQQNVKGKPNENFARELMELFTIGRGNYTEQDVKEAARAFTGWSSTLQGAFIFRNRVHDFESKTFMGKTGHFDGDDIIDIILDKKETAYFISKKIYTYFVNEKIQEDEVKEMAKIFYASDYNIGTLMEHLFTSDWFYEERNIGSKIKSPVEFIAGMIRSLEVSFKNKMGILFTERALGQTLFRPPNVAGWPGGKSWIDNSTLMLRLNLVNLLYKNTEVKFEIGDEAERESFQGFKKFNGSLNLQNILDNHMNTPEDSLQSALMDFFLADPSSLKETRNLLEMDNSSKAEKIKELTFKILSLPEYQMC